ncbi:N-acetylmuramoyl-L-alanine amidase [Sphingomonas sp. AOB5]|uniref:N-acetylmuramoyl-L-alanine amidase n=1 Tax=Sphingomonas sp. AOB5 TaxID=3034017 RepID=UPI0023F8F88A|nr:N-acetylmuramoyl-L-alanine amidase [Sphingomonas sp. AOB5]MDF7776592.1 N-acetylmuramoyl-L-alanine amidase [Sphingomonas sp. AOB5]
MPDTSLIARLAQIYAGQGIRYSHLKTVTLAQWMLESGRGTSDLAKLHYNFGGLKWRPEMGLFATKVMYQAHDGLDAYCKFSTLENFISGYWAFIGRAPYSGWESHVATAEDYIRFIGPIYTPKPSYADDVIKLMPEAAKLLADGSAVAKATTGTDIGTVVLDPGHGGEAKVGGSSPNNAISVSNVKEKKLALDFCFILRDELIKQATAAGQKIQVVMTRTTDVNVGIAQRAALAGTSKAKAFVCLHFNGGVATAQGAETFYAAAANGNLNEAEDKAFATAIHAGLIAGMKSIHPGAKDRGVKPDTQSGPKVMGVLRDTALGNIGKSKKCLGAYIEAEFITNPTIDKLLISGPDAVPNRTKVMASVAKALRAHMAAN